MNNPIFLSGLNKIYSKFALFNEVFFRPRLINKLLSLSGPK